ncbi:MULTISPECIES: flagellar basal body-associated protein FliL [unclassified Yoonia]|uniref:flagellar basal body-associated protein FliL n=1 Tax=unclassified Yoonia TaxID=2629118 RepID=UPI002AFDF20B|nr:MULTISPECIES: flagellar basal body-associated protein FliL [unclassified Yoonia]
MKAILIPAILALVGTGAGVGTGLMLRPEAEDAEAQASCTCSDLPAEGAVAATPEPDIGAAREYARLNNQFIIPVVEDGRVAALVVLSLNLEVVPGAIENVFAAEPKLRDGFLQDMFDHANIGGFSGNFTEGTNMRALRNNLLRTAQGVIGNDVTDVLIMDIVRQDS